MIKKELLAYSLLVIQPIFMASNLVVARGGVEYIPPISLAFWRWLTVFLILLIFNYTIFSKKKIVLKEYKKLFFLGFMGCGVCGAFPFIAGQTTTIINMGIIYTSSPIFIILISYFFFKEKMNLLKIIGLISCLLGVIIIIIKGDYLALIELMFTKGDLWMLGASIGWALYSIFLFYWKSSLKVFERFTLISLFGALSLLPFYLTEEIFIKSTTFDTNFIIWVTFAAVSPGIIYFSEMSLICFSTSLLSCFKNNDLSFSLLLSKYDFHASNGNLLSMHIFPGGPGNLTKQSTLFLLLNVN